MDITISVIERYSAGAKAREAELCCPVDYDSNLLQALPNEIIERDYGCGDPSRYVQPGDTVLDLGSGGGKICYMAAQIVGPSGQVIGVDMNDDMLELTLSKDKSRTSGSMSKSWRPSWQRPQLVQLLSYKLLRPGKMNSVTRHR